MGVIKRLTIKGYKSICDDEMELQKINILIGGNGAGKSNLLSFFRMINDIKQHNFQNHIMQQGGANVILYNGKKATKECIFCIERGGHSFYCRLEPGAADSLFISEQRLYETKSEKDIYASDGFMELKDNGMIKRVGMLEGIGNYHFQDTGASSLMKSYCSIDNNIQLAEDGNNLAAILYRIKKVNEESYRSIVQVIQLVAPYFLDFVLRENPLRQHSIRLEWRKMGCDMPFAADQLSDGTLRFICLATLLLSPKELRQDIVIIDEPELGLHPFAITIISELIKKASVDRQLIIATQSVEFLNQFEPENVIVVNNVNGISEFNRLDTDNLREWLADYTLGELWEKNVLGGRP